MDVLGAVLIVASMAQALALLFVVWAFAAWSGRMPIYSWAATRGYRVVKCTYLVRHPQGSALPSLGFFYDVVLEAPGGMREHYLVRFGVLTVIGFAHMDRELLVS